MPIGNAVTSSPCTAFDSRFPYVVPTYADIEGENSLLLLLSSMHIPSCDIISTTISSISIHHQVRYQTIHIISQ